MNAFENKSGWQRVTIDSHACDVFLPKVRNDHGFVVLYLHDIDGGSLAQRPVIQTLLEEHGLPCVAPISGHSWWADHVVPAFDAERTPEQFVRENVMQWIESQMGAKPPEVALFGIGMGGQGALRIAYKYPEQFPVVSAIAPDLDYHFHLREGDEVLFAIYGDTEAARQDTAILHIHPLNWPRHQFLCANPADYHTFEGADRLRMKMASTGVLFDIDLETSADSAREYIDEMAPHAIGYLADRLKKEWLRVV